MSLVADFLQTIHRFIVAKNPEKLSEWFQVEDGRPGGIYPRMADELRASFPTKAGDDDESSEKLQRLVDRYLPESDEAAGDTDQGTPWPGFNMFVRDYLEYWRDIDFADGVLAYSLLLKVITACGNALTNPTHGEILLGTSMALSETLCRLIIGITRFPELLAHIHDRLSSRSGGQTKSIVEQSADIVQKLFTSCLADRTSGRWDAPRGKKVYVYRFANLVLKLLFACKKGHLAAQMFTNLDATGPALALYPASQRVTFLYYLGRFYLEHDNFWQASRCFEEAWCQLPPAFASHRRHILTYWVPSEMVLGRFPSQQLLRLPEAAGFAEIYLPIRSAVRKGNFPAFYAALDANPTTASDGGFAAATTAAATASGPGNDFLWQKGLYLTLRYRLQPLVWRSLTRRVFMLVSADESPGADGGAGGGVGGSESNKAAFLSLDHILTAAIFTQQLLEGWHVPAPAPVPAGPRQRPPHINSIFLQAVTNANANVAATTTMTTLVPPADGPRRLMPAEGLVLSNKRPDAGAVESTVMGLIYQGLLNGWLARVRGDDHLVFAIEGARRKGGNALLAGWPPVHEMLVERRREAYDDALEAWRAGEAAESPGEDRERWMAEVPGWVKAG